MTNRHQAFRITNTVTLILLQSNTKLNTMSTLIASTTRYHRLIEKNIALFQKVLRSSSKSKQISIRTVY